MDVWSMRKSTMKNVVADVFCWNKMLFCVFPSTYNIRASKTKNISIGVVHLLMWRRNLGNFLCRHARELLEEKAKEVFLLCLVGTRLEI